MITQLNKIYMKDAVQSNCEYKPRKWYNYHRFPLIPVFEARKANHYNTNGFTFEWLFIKAWTLDSCSFEIGVTCSGHWGIGVLGLLPYLRWVVAVPIPLKLDFWIQKHLWRKCKSDLEMMNNQ
jgi:hypothetical protein